MFSYFLVMSGGAVGAGLRFALAQLMPHAAGAWPRATFLVNVIGSLCIGILTFWLVRKGAQGEQFRLLFGVGLLGGFTTFSAFSLEIAQMIERGQIVMGLTYATASVLAAVIAVFAGMALAKAAWA